MPMEIARPKAWADLPLTPAYPTWVKPEPADNPTKHRKTFTFVRAIMSAWDRVALGAKSAAYCHGASTAPADALDFLGETYGGLARALIDTDDSYRAYLSRPGPVERWHTFGTRRGLLGELLHLGYPNARVVTWRELVAAGAAAGNVVFGGHTSFFYVAINYPSAIQPVTARWDDGTSRWGDGVSTWGGAGAGGQQADELRRVIQMVKPAHTSCRFVVLFADAGSGLNAQLLPTGNFTTIPLNEPWERIRPSYAYRSYYTHSPLVP